MVNIGVVGLGKMGLSHLSIVNAHEDVKVVGACDSSGYVLDVLGKYTGIPTFADLDAMLASTSPDAVIVATPSKLHAPMVRKCIDQGLHVLCEKPFCLDPVDSAELAQLAAAKGIVTQVGYHNRHVAAFAEVKRLLESGALGRVTHVLAEAYGPVVLKRKGGTWRSKKDEGGGALYDYAAHPIDLLTWYFGRPAAVSGTHLGHVFSEATEDEVFTTLDWGNGMSGQLSVSWSDDSQRKMSTRITIWGTNGKIYADRQEVQAYLRDGSLAPDEYDAGWTVRYTTELTDEVDFYVRGEEYSAQIDDFIARINGASLSVAADFAQAVGSDETMFAIANNDGGGRRAVGDLTKVPAVAESGRFAAWRSRRRARRASLKEA